MKSGAIERCIQECEGGTPLAWRESTTAEARRELAALKTQLSDLEGIDKVCDEQMKQVEAYQATVDALKAGGASAADRKALQFISDIANEELQYAKVGTGAEVALRHISRRADERLSTPAPQVATTDSSGQHATVTRGDEGSGIGRTEPEPLATISELKRLLRWALERMQDVDMDEDFLDDHCEADRTEWRTYFAAARKAVSE